MHSLAWSGRTRPGRALSYERCTSSTRISQRCTTCAREWPRGQRIKRDKKQVVCEVRFTLSPEELEKLGEIAGQELSVTNVVVAKDYGGNFEIRFPEDSTLFPGVVPPNSIDAICHTLPEPTEPVGENFRAVVTKCILEVKRYAKEGRFKELTLRVRARHAAALKKQLTEEDIEPQRANENQFIGNYKAKLTKVKAKLVAERTKHQKAQDYIVSQLPTFIYMDDYKAFQGRANLEGLKERLNNKKLDLSEEDETFLMILKLGGLDLDELIKQGESEDQDVIHDRQVDLQDASKTLTNNVADAGARTSTRCSSGPTARFSSQRLRRRTRTLDDPARGSIEGIPVVLLIRSALHARQRRNLRGVCTSAR